MIPAQIKALILDMDGVIWKAGTPIGDLPAVFSKIEARGLKYIFATNNSTLTSAEYVSTLASLGVYIKPEQVINSSIATAEMLKNILPKGTPIFVIGESGIKNALQESGFVIVSTQDAEKAKAVVMGIDREINFNKIREATLLVRNGIPFYATNPDMTFPTPRGEIPGNGSWISVVTSATNIQPVYAGKPEPFMMELAVKLLGFNKNECLVVGDRLETDIAAGQAVGCPTALVLSGVASREQGLAWKPAPTMIAESLTELIK